MVVWPIVIWPRKSKVSPFCLRVSLTVTGFLSIRLVVDAGQRLAVDGEVDHKAVLALGVLLGGIAEIEARGGHGLALPRLLQDDVGIAVHQPVDGGEIPRLDRIRIGLGVELDLGGDEIGRGGEKAGRNHQEQAHANSSSRAGIDCGL